MAESNKPEATGQAGELTQETVVRDLEKELDRLDGFIAETLVSPSDTAEDVIGKVADVLAFLSLSDSDYGDLNLAGARLSPRRGSSLIIESCAEALVIANRRIGGAA